MPLTVTTYPPSSHFARDNAWIGLSSSVTPQQNAFLLLVVTGSLSLGDTLTFTFNSIDVQFTCTINQTDTGHTLPQQGAESIKDYVDILQQFLQRNYLLQSTFDISRSSPNSGQEMLVFRSRTLTLFDFAFATTSTALVVNTLQNPNANAPSYSVVMQVEELALNNAVYPLGLRSAPLGNSTQVEFDVSNSLALRAVPPPSTALNVGYQFFTIYGMSIEYQIRAALQEGAPPTTEALDLRPHPTFQSYVAIHGRSPTFGYNPLKKQANKYGIYVMHPLTERVVVLPSEPAFRYLFATTNLVQDQLSIDISVWRNGVEEQISHPLALAPLARGNTYVVPVGFTQLSLHTLVDSHLITHYSVHFNLNDDNLGPRRVFMGVFMLTRECPDYTTYLLVDNQIGGCDVLRLQGRQQWARPASSTFVVNPSRFGSSGSVAEGARIVQDSIAGSTGFVSKEWAQHMAGAMPCRAWIIAGGQFLEGYLERTSDVYFDTYSNLYSIPLNFTLAADQS